MQFTNGKFYKLKSGVASNSKCVKASDLEQYDPVRSYRWNIQLTLDGIRYAVPTNLIGYDTSLYCSSGLDIYQLNEYEPNTYLVSGSQTHYLSVNYGSEYNLPLLTEMAISYGGEDMNMWCSDYLMVGHDRITFEAFKSNVNQKEFSKAIDNVGPTLGRSNHYHFKFYTYDDTYVESNFYCEINVDDITDLSSNVYSNTGYITVTGDDINISDGVLTRTTIINEITFVGTV